MSRQVNEKDSSIIPSIEMVYVEGGSFLMGDEKSEDSLPVHEVQVPSFHLGVYPITNAQFVPFLNEKGNQEEEGRLWVNLEGNYQGVKCGIQKNAKGFECKTGLEKHPIIYLNWYGAVAYCQWLSDKTGQVYHLPSEAEWEYAAGEGNQSKGFPYAGGHKLKELGWYRKNSHRQTKPVGLKKPNALGLYDMSGNVWEWCADHWHENYEQAPTDGSAWITGGENSRRVVRGGSWYVNYFNCRVSLRFRYYSNFRVSYIGFRVARY